MQKITVNMCVALDARSRCSFSELTRCLMRGVMSRNASVHSGMSVEEVSAIELMCALIKLVAYPLALFGSPNPIALMPLPRRTVSTVWSNAKHRLRPFVAVTRC